MSVDEVNEFQQRLAVLESDIVRLTAIEQGQDEFFKAYLEQIVAVLGVGGCVWVVSEGNETHRSCHLNLAAADVDDEGRQYGLLAAGLSKVFETSGAVVLPGQGGSDLQDGGLGEAGVNESPHTLLFVPMLSSGSIAAVLLLISPEDVDPRAVRGYAGFVQGLCGCAGAFLERSRIKDLEGQVGRSVRFRDYISALHGSLDPRRACYALANYGQELLGVYRCMAGTYGSSGKFRIESVSGLESVAIKSSFVQRVSHIARDVCRNDKVLLVDNPDAVTVEGGSGGDDLISQGRLFMLEAGSKYMGVFPISHDGHVVGAMVVEKATEEPIDDAERRQIEVMLAEAGSALGNCLSFYGIPVFARWVGSCRDHVYRMGHTRQAIWAAVLLLLCILPFVISKEVRVVGKAELVPAKGRIAYAQRDGVIESVSIPEGRMVEQGAILASLDTALVDKEIYRIRKEIDAATAALTTASSKSRPGSSEVLRLKYALEAKEAELDQYKLLREEYELRSPVHGSVITRDSVIRQLYGRPVSRGEAVLEVVPDDTAWELTVSVAEAEAGDLLRAYDALGQGEQLRAWVILNAYPELTFESRVRRVSRQAHIASTGEKDYRNVIEVVVIEPEGLRAKVELLEGLEGKVGIECGRRSLFYVVTHEFVDFIRVGLF